MQGSRKELTMAFKGQGLRSSSLPCREKEWHLGEEIDHIRQRNVKLHLSSEKIEQVEANG